MLGPRYARQEAFPGIGREGQARLRRASVAIVGVGATGSVLALAAVRAGVGRVRIIDRDVVDTGNLHRQFLFDDADARDGAPKALAAAERLRAGNPEVAVEALAEDLTSRNAERLLEGADLIFDGTDNFETRFIVNDIAVRSGTPWVYAGVIASTGHVMAIRPGLTACFRCYLGEAPPPGSVETCETAGVLGPAVLAVGGLAAAAGLKIIAGDGPTEASLFTIDVWTQATRSIVVPRDPLCPTCNGRFDHLREAQLPPAAALCGRDAVHVRPPPPAGPLDLRALAERLRAAGIAAEAGPLAARFEAEGLHATLFADGRAIVRGTGDPGRARAFYARWVGG